MSPRPNPSSRRPDALSRPAGIAFDLDGTLVDTVAARIDGWLEALSAVGIAAKREDIAPMIGMDGKRLARLVGEAAGRELDEAALERIDRAAGTAFDRLNQDPRPLPGFRELLAAIEDSGVRWLIATSSRAEQVRRSVEALELSDEPLIVDGSSVKRAKPAPDLVLLAAQRMGVQPDRCWAVGDSTWDMRAAVAAGMAGVGVLAGAAVDGSALEDAGASLVVETLGDLAPALRS